ncbi:T9SS type B sorting domain-containing protein [Lutibacter sp. HS1-25]|uniref:Ig-like domain-containing protein n=1 Tax=Lutibacter sp. HS1-25 TaxID=2485000 RepID=UPI0013E93BC4|nr:T9SS type B sorting domain-containing protein [Lutibacter sp. HS1-25]
MTKNILLRLFFLFFIVISNKNWAQTPPVLTALGNQAYCPLSNIPIVTDFTLTSGTNQVDAIFIQISTGYVNGQDRLQLLGNHPNITEQPFNTLEGKLELKWTGSGIANDAELIAAVKEVVYRSTALNPANDKTFSITVGEANYLPSTGHYYEYVPSLGITWTSAKTAAEGRKYYGLLQGYLATITSADEAKLSGAQAAGAGWIGGSDAAVEGTWRWVTGPENGKSFWIGNGSGSTVGTDIPFAFWNSANGEPNNLGNEDYAHVTAPGIGQAGSWNDLSNTGGASGDYQPKGYIVEYGGMPGDPVLNLSAYTQITMPQILTTSANTPLCGSGIATITANSNTGYVIWYDSPTGGTKLGTGSTYNSPLPINTTTSYYALASADGICETGTRVKIDIVVNSIPTIISAPPSTICGAGIGILNASASAGTINWYNSPTGGTLLGTGNSFTSQVITNTTTYYIDATDKNCTTLTRTPIVLNVEYTPEPTAPLTQSFCDIANATLANLSITGTNVLWYATATGGVALPISTVLVNNTTYYASQTLNTCESATRFAVNVKVYETVVALPPANIPVISTCDNASDGDDTNGFSTFDLTVNNSILLNNKNASDFTFSYFEDPSYSLTSEILTPSNFVNTIKDGQPIYVKISNNLDSTCLTETKFNIQVNSLPVITSTATLLNCDEDGNYDGYTDFNLTEANNEITNGDNSLIVNYYLTLAEANSGITPPINPSPFNNATASTVYARVENANGCYRVATVNLKVSTTHFPIGYMANLSTCDSDATIDGYETFDLTLASQEIIDQFPTGQNLSVHYYRNLTDAQLEENEILPQNAYKNQNPFSQILYVRVESEDNGDCFGIGPHLTLTVFPRPQFEVNPTEIVCLNLPPITLAPNNAQGTYTYQWFNENGDIISNQPIVSVSKGGIYTVIATSGANCKSFPQTVTVTESVIANITQKDVTITDDSSENAISINNENNNLGIGDYEFALDNSYGPYQDSPIFNSVPAGIHTIYVQDKNNCGIASIEVSVIGFPKFFTPNNDGFNDTWHIDGVNAQFYPTATIYIFDRFGKLLTQLNASSNGWDGNYNGESLPPTDYWFSAQLIDNDGNIREKKSHFSLIRK